MAIKKFPFRALILGAILSVVVAAYSAYAGLKVGGVYWPIVTTSLISLSILKFLGRTDKNEVNIMQTTGSSGGLLAAGVVFTIPAAIMLGFRISYLEILLTSLVGGILGVVFSYPLRKQLIEREKLPCQDGVAAAALISAGDKGGKSAKVLMYSFGAGAVFSFVRDYLKLFPSYFNLESLKIDGIAKSFSFGSSLSLIPFAGGFLIGPRFTAAWFLGAIVTYFGIIPYAIASGAFSSKFSVVSEIARPLGVGIVLGSGMIFFIMKGLPVFSKMIDDWKDAKARKMAGIALIVCMGVIALVTNMDLPLAFVAIIGAFAVSYLAGRSTAEMNVDPMEIFAMLVMLAAKMLGFSAFPLILLAAIVTIAAGIAGDMMQDLKAGYLLKTDLSHQLIAQIVGMASASIAIGAILLALQANGFGTIDFPAPQAVAIKELASASGLTNTLMLGMLIGGALSMLFLLKRKELGMTPIAFGIGMYVPIELSFPLFVGGLIRHYFDKKKAVEKARLVAGAVIAGEGIVGVSLTLLGLIFALR
ncbi:OPT/YSL family transporter [Candidatus Micrarchaeota archaeon]|nr:OPT/YSL family transporter [Candidatus Micrarchaeota archaeon]